MRERQPEASWQSFPRFIRSHHGFSLFAHRLSLFLRTVSLPEEFPEKHARRIRSLALEPVCGLSLHGTLSCCKDPFLCRQRYRAALLRSVRGVGTVLLHCVPVRDALRQGIGGIRLLSRGRDGAAVLLWDLLARRIGDGTEDRGDPRTVRVAHPVALRKGSVR